MKLILSVFIGSGLGGVCRYLISRCMNHLTHYQPGSFPWATFVVNITGCFLIGLIFALADKSTISDTTKTLLATGFCGGLTTFSTFTYEGLSLLQSHHLPQFLLYTLFSLLLGLLAAYVAIRLFH